MKSSSDDLEKRGFLKEGEENEFLHVTLETKLEYLKSQVPKKRTLGARLLSQEKRFVADKLIEALKVENKLYSKIEICKALEKHKNDSVPLLIKELGKIGANQHHSLPEKEFGKDNYPLPRDIVARILANIGKSALPELIVMLETGKQYQQSEAIDAIGYICFYDYQPHIFEKLKACYLKHKQDDLLCWKLIRAMSAFPESLVFLREEHINHKNERIKKEINRSIRLLEKRKNKLQ